MQVLCKTNVKHVVKGKNMVGFKKLQLKVQ